MPNVGVTAGPMAHPIRPESYIKMDNFYTLTVYEKGVVAAGLAGRASRSAAWRWLDCWLRGWRGP